MLGSSLEGWDLTARHLNLVRLSFLVFQAGLLVQGRAGVSLCGESLQMLNLLVAQPLLLLLLLLRKRLHLSMLLLLSSVNRLVLVIRLRAVRRLARIEVARVEVVPNGKLISNRQG